MAYNSCVNYVEPNVSSIGVYKTLDSGFTEWKYKDDYERTPRLEDYTIYFNLEVEVCGRENISANNTITTDVLVLSYRTKPDGSGSTVNFMGGTKIKCNDTHNSEVQYLTTNYADMYVGDLIDYGTTEMIGVKSVNVEFQNACIPVITAQFTDVRGLSLFQPTELSRTNTYQGIGGINSDNVAQSFFQCFFRVPMPKFTITIKGFYGNPVSYEVMCDKFDTKFNSKTGDFDITTRFIGYSYSFLTDISIDALLAAPYSDYGGKNGNYNRYWDQEKNSERFTIWNKEKTVKLKMPTLFEIWQEMKSLLSEPIEVETSLTEEENNHQDEIEELTKIKSLYQTWYKKLFNECCEKYGKDYSFLFKTNDRNGDYTRILVLAKENANFSLQQDYQQYSDEFKKIHKDLYTAIEKFNSNDSSFKKIENVSEDFGDYVLQFLFNKTYIGNKNQVVFDGFDKRNRIPETQVQNNVFYGISYSGNTREEIEQKRIQHKKHVLNTIWNDGVEQYIRCYSIEEDYTAISSRIKALQTDANRNEKDKLKEKKIKAINREMFNRMSWYPTVENFTRIMMAHLETLMHLMYTTVTKCADRTAEELGVTTGPDGECIDVNAAKDVIPPFPRVTKEVMGDDGITKIEDTWVGEYNSGEKAFEEVDFIDGFFNAIEKMQALKRDTEAKLVEKSKNVPTTNTSPGSVIKHPLSSFDFYISKNPYGDSSEISNDLELYQFAGKVALRMYDILCLNYLRLELGSSFLSTENVQKIGSVEAENFYDCVKLTNDKFIGMLRDGIITPDLIIEKISKKEPAVEYPWRITELFSKASNGLSVKAYNISKDTYKNTIYPIQNISFNELNELRSLYMQGKISNGDGNISIKTIPIGTNESTIHTNNGFGCIYITDNYEIPSNALNGANTNENKDYTVYYNKIVSASTFNDEEYSSFLTVDGKISISSSSTLVDGKKNITFEPEGEFLKISDEENNSFVYGNDNISSIGSQARQKNLLNYTITEVFGISDDNSINFETSYYNTNNKIDGSMSFGDLVIDGNDFKSAIALLCIRTNNAAFDEMFYKKNKTFIYLPKLCALKIGIICFASGGVNKTFSNLNEIFNTVSSSLNIKGTSIDSKLIKIVLNSSKQVRYQFAKYFYDWVKCTGLAKKMHIELIKESNYVKSKVQTNRSLLNQNSNFTTNLTNELLKPMLIINLSVCARNYVSDSWFVISQGLVKAYLESFIKRLKEKYDTSKNDDNSGNQVKTTDDPKHTNDDMKIELYRYMKQVYDKWIPMSSFDNWKVETFFPESGRTEIGHTFHFIDSYYNYIGDKLLINPKKLAENIGACLENGDINAMMLGFMADIYAFNRCMLKCIQNFSDLSKGESMDKMFVPIPANSINWNSEINKFPSFVVVYPYEPSKNLNVANNEYNDDGFMLNDELETPKAIRTKTDDRYRIPAFGVSYGKQYQSYFKSVNVNMQNPIATEQAIKAKHFIIQQAATQKEIGLTSQDLYDIYSTQSYTCDVEMMGCAWVQPLMYFVLLNVPMFRGSYMIMKVKHSIKPGDMTTTFTGCRMANMSTKLIENIFTDNDFLPNEEYNEEPYSDRELKADIDNDCKYKIYPLFENDANVNMNDNESSKSVKAFNFIKNYVKGEGVSSDDAAEKIAAGICGNIMQESRFNEYAINSNSYAAGLCQWLPAYHLFRDMYDNKYENYGHWQGGNQTGLSAKSDTITLVKQRDFNYQLKFAMDSVFKNKNKDFKNLANKLKNATTVSQSTTLWCNLYERPGDAEKHLTKRENYANEILKKAKSQGTAKTSEPTSKDPNDKKDIAQAFFDAVNKSAQDTPSIGVELRLGTKKFINDNHVIVQKNGKSDKLGVVFDMILNSEYYNYVQSLGYVYPNGGLSTNCPPNVIFYRVTEKVDINKKFVWITQENNNIETMLPVALEDGNETLLKPLAKRYKTVGNENKFKKEVPQVNDIKILEKYMPQDCDAMFDNNSSNNGGNNGDSTQTSKASEVSPNDSGTIDGWDVGKACAWIISHGQGCRTVNGKRNCGRSQCASYVEDAIEAGGGPLSNRIHTSENGGETIHATNLRYYGILEKRGFVKIDEGIVQKYGNCKIPLQAGDIAIIGKNAKLYGGNYHACMYTASKGWYSDFKQNNMNVYNSEEPYAIYRFRNKKKS